MYYKIIETHTIYKNEEIVLLAVLWQANENGAVRATWSTNIPCAGYKFLVPGDTINQNLLLEVAGKGMNLPDYKKRIYFPGKRVWER